jgi:RNA polymerase sigma factor (sigma-70 family)
MPATAKRYPPLTPAQQELAASCHNMVLWMLTQMPGIVRHDISADSDAYIEAGYEALCRAASSYEPDLGNQFSTLAHKCIRRAFMSTHIYRQAKNVEHCYGAMQFLTDRWGDERRPDWLAADAETAEKLWELVAGLPMPYRHFLYDYYKTGMTLKQIGDREHITAERVRQRLVKGCKILRLRCKRLFDPDTEPRPLYHGQHRVVREAAAKMAVA